MLLRSVKPDKLDAEDDAALQVSADDQLDVFYDDDQQPIYQTDRRSPRRWFLPSPQSNALFFPPEAGGEFRMNRLSTLLPLTDS